MGKKILVITVCAALLFSFASCKSKKEEAVSTTVAATTETTAASKEKQKTKEKQTQSSSEKSQATTEKQVESGEKSKKQDKSQSVTKKNSDGTFSIKGVKVDVVKYSDASLSDGKQLIEKLVEGAVKNGEILDKSETDNSAVYIISGTNKSNSKAQFYKLQYIQDGSEGYLITYTADSREALGQDLNYVTQNYKELAR